MDLRDFFRKQLPDSVRDAFDNASSHKGFFVQHDALHNLEHDIVFTVLRRYTCGSNCQTCFLKGHWIPEQEMAPFIPSLLTEDDRANIVDIISRFSSVCCIDDLRGLKTNHPHLFDFYRGFAPMMEFHTSDNGFFTQYPILMNDVQFQRIGQLSFSDYILDKKDGRIVDDIIKMLCELNDRSPIARLNFVITKGNPENNRNVMKLADWATKVDDSLAIYFHNDIRQDVDFFSHLREMGYRQPSAYYIEHSTNPPTKCNVFTETVHLRNNEFFPDLYTSMDLGDQPFYVAHPAFDVGEFMIALLNEKLTVYRRNRDIMSEHNRLWEYFSWVVDHVRINRDFTFIPAAMLDPGSQFYRCMVRDGWTNTYAGLIRTGAQKVIPIVEVLND